MPDNHCCCCNCDQLPDVLTITLSTTDPKTATFTCGNGQTCQTTACGGYITGAYIVEKSQLPGQCQWGGGGQLPNVINCNVQTCQPLNQTWTNTLTLTFNQISGESGPRFRLSVHSAEPPVNGVQPPNILTCFQSDVLDCANISFPAMLRSFFDASLTCSACGPNATATVGQ